MNTLIKKKKSKRTLRNHLPKLLHLTSINPKCHSSFFFIKQVSKYNTKELSLSSLFVIALSPVMFNVVDTSHMWLEFNSSSLYVNKMKILFSRYGQWNVATLVTLQAHNVHMQLMAKILNSIDKEHFQHRRMLYWVVLSFLQFLFYFKKANVLRKRSL